MDSAFTSTFGRPILGTDFDSPGSSYERDYLSSKPKARRKKWDTRLVEEALLSQARIKTEANPQLIPFNIETNSASVFQEAYQEAFLDRQISKLKERLAEKLAVCREGLEEIKGFIRKQDLKSFEGFLLRNDEILPFLVQTIRAFGSVSEIKSLSLEYYEDLEEGGGQIFLVIGTDIQDFDARENYLDRLFDEYFEPNSNVNKGRVVLSLA